MASAQFRKDRMDAVITALFDLPLGDLLEGFVRDHGHSDPVMFQAIGFKNSVDASRAIEVAHRMMMQLDSLYHRSRARLDRIRKPVKAAKPAPGKAAETATPAQAIEFPPAHTAKKRFEPEDYLCGMTREETLDLLRRDIYRPGAIDKLTNQRNEPEAA